jgi:hypothetical protein
VEKHIETLRKKSHTKFMENYNFLTNRKSSEIHLWAHLKTPLNLTC